MIKFMKEILDKLLSVILSLLPLSPFADAIDNLSQLPYLGYLNYFVPVGTCLGQPGLLLSHSSICTVC